MKKKAASIIFHTASLVLAITTGVVMSRVQPGDEKLLSDLLIISAFCLFVGMYLRLP